MAQFSGRIVNIYAKLKSYYERHKNTYFKNYKEVLITSELNQLLKPATPLKSSLAAISISHSPFMGAFVFSNKANISIGLDIEIADRVSVRVIHRVSSNKEIKQAPDNTMLWAAKESAFKCISTYQNLISLKECLISNWVKAKNATYYFNFHCLSSASQKTVSPDNKLPQCISGTGLAMHWNNLIFSYTQLI